MKNARVGLLLALSLMITAPALAARGQKPAVLEERTDLTVPAIKTFVRHGVLFMPMFRKTEVSDADLDAIAAYLTRNNKP